MRPRTRSRKSPGTNSAGKKIRFTETGLNRSSRDSSQKTISGTLIATGQDEGSITPIPHKAVDLKIRQIDPGTRALREAISASITPIAWLLAVLYGSLAAIHPFVLSGENRWPMALVAAVSSILSAAIALAWKKSPRPTQAHLVSGLLAGIALVNTVLHFALFRQAVNTTNFVILILGLGLVLLSRVSFYSILALALAAWVTIVTLFNVPEPSEWGWFLFFAAFVGSILEEQRI